MHQAVHLTQPVQTRSKSRKFYKACRETLHFSASLNSNQTKGPKELCQMHKTLYLKGHTILVLEMQCGSLPKCFEIYHTMKDITHDIESDSEFESDSTKVDLSVHVLQLP